MSQALSPLTARFAAIGLLLLVILLASELLVPPLLYLTGIDGERAAMIERIVRLERAAARLPALRKALDAAGTESAAGQPYLDEASDSLAAAALQMRLRRTALAAGLEVASVQPAAAASEPGLAKAAAAMTVSGSLAAHQRLIYQLEAEDPILFVEEFEVLNTNPERPRLDEAGQPVLQLRLTVAGFRRAP